MAQIIDGKALAAKIKQDIKTEVDKLDDNKPGLAVILVGEDPASQTYVGGKEKDAQECGFYSEIHRLPADTTEQELMLLISKLNCNENINGILVQLPLPTHLNEDKITNQVKSIKDVDGFTYESSGRLLTGADGLVACTPSGCIEMLKSTGQDLAGKTAVVIGRSTIVGKPMALLLLQENATVTICHSKTKNLKEITKQADILVAAIGRAKFVTEEMVKDGAIVIDVGMNRDENNKLCGDVDFEKVRDKALFITPVPGGVGPMTRAILMKNTLKAYKIQRKIVVDP